MKAVVIGSGLLGVSTAWSLCQRGVTVTVLDRAQGPGRETSFANGALLTPSMADPWNSPGVLWKLLRWLGREDSPMLLRARALPSLLTWGLQFVHNSSEKRYRANTLLNARLATYSLEVLRSLRTEHGISYGGGAVGTLRLFRERATLDDAREMAEWLADNGVQSRRLDREETIALEPALHSIAGELVGSIHYPDDEHGDALRFCEALAARARGAGVQFLYDTTVHMLERQGTRISHVVGECESWPADAVVIAAGSYSPQLVRNLGIRVPVQPVKGYSITVSLDGINPVPRVPILDDDLHAVAVPLDGRLRLAGTAEFTGFDLAITPARIENLRRLLARTYPVIASSVSTGQLAPWTGLRPMSSDGVPIIGRTRYENLFLNTGHGPLGWTMAAGSGRALADLIVGRSCEIDLAPYGLERFR